MKNLIFLIITVILFQNSLFSQTATLTIGSVEATMGQTIDIPVTLSSTTPVLATQFEISFDQTVLNPGSIVLKNFHSSFPDFEWVTNVLNGVIYANWVNSALIPVTVQPNTVLFEIECQYVMGETDLNWNLALLVDAGLQTIPVTTTNGSVIQYVAPEILVKLADVAANPNSVVTIPATISGADVNGTPILAAELNITFDPEVIDPSTITLTDFNPLMPSFEWITNVSNGIIYANWVSSSLIAVALPDNSTMFSISGQYIQGESELVWSMALFVDENGQEITTVTINGSVSPATSLISVWEGTGNWNDPAYWSSGIPGDITEAIIAGGVVTIDGTASCKSLTVNAETGVTISTTGNLTVVDDLTLASELNDKASGSLINNGVLLVNGTITAQRWFSGGQNHFISSPVEGATLNMLYNPSNPGYFYQYNEPLKNWTNLYQLNDPLNPGFGYALNYISNEMVEFNGVLNNNSSYSPFLSFTDSDGGDDGWNLIGNPYSSAIDWENQSWIKNNLEGGIYFYNGTNYETYNGGYGVPSTASQFIPAYQGFFVKVFQANAAISIPKAAQVHSAQNYYDNREVNNALRLSVTNQQFSDETLIRFDINATNQFDAQLDAFKLYSFNSNVPQLFSVTNTQQTINALPDQGTGIWNAVSVNLGIKLNNSGNYTINASGFDSFNSGSIESLELYDNNTGIYTDLIHTPNYSFTSEPGTFLNRFKLYFNRTVTGTSNFEMSNVEIYAFDKQIFINNGKGVVSVTNILGQEIYRQNLTENVSNVVNVAMSGIYLVKITDDQHVTNITKVYVK